jgi:hypothetical protein
MPRDLGRIPLEFEGPTFRDLLKMGSEGMVRSGLEPNL